MEIVSMNKDIKFNILYEFIEPETKLVLNPLQDTKMIFVHQSASIPNQITIEQKEENRDRERSHCKEKSQKNIFKL